MKLLSHLLFLLVFAESILFTNSASADIVLFSANYDNSLDAQTTPPNGESSPVITDSDSDLGISSGISGYKGGEALSVVDMNPTSGLGDFCTYKMDDTYPNTTWFPAHGRATIYFKIVRPDNGKWINMMTFHYGQAGYETYGEFSVWLGMGNYDGLGFGGWAELRTYDGWYDAIYHVYNNGTVSGAPSQLPGKPMVTPGWHKCVVEWTISNPGSTQHKLGNVLIYVDDKLGLPLTNVHIGPVSTYEKLQLGSGLPNGIYPIGYFGGLYDQVKIEEIIGLGPQYCGDNNSVYAAGDLNQDCRVDFNDLLLLTSQWCQNNVYANASPPYADSNYDSKVDLKDYALVASTWMQCTDPFESGCPGYAPPASPVVLKADQVLVSLSSSYSVNFNIPAGQHKVFLAFDGRIVSSDRNAYAPPVASYYINDHVISNPDWMVNVPDARDLITSTGMSVTWLNANNWWRLPYAPDFSSFTGNYTPSELGDKPYQMVLQISDFLYADKSNKLEIRCATVDTQLAFQNIRLLFDYNRPGYDPNLRDLPELNDQAVLPRTDFSANYTRTVFPGGGLAVTIGGTQYNIESRYSVPNGTWNTLKSASTAQGEWSVNVNGSTVTATGSKYRLNRTVTNYLDRVEISDTLTNLTSQQLGLRFAHEIKISKSLLKKAYYNGLRLPYKSYGFIQVSENAPMNPTVYICNDTAGIGLLPRDDVFRSHIGFNMVDGAYGLEDDWFGLAPYASYTIKWEIYPTNKNSYFDFVNAARLNLQANYTIPGNTIIPYTFYGNMTGITDSAISDVVRFNNVKYMILAGNTYKYDSAGNTLSGNCMGADIMSSSNYYTRYWLEQNIARLRNVVPNVKLLPYANVFITTEPDAITRYPDSYAQNYGGTPSYAYPGMPSMYPTATNTYGAAIKSALDYFLQKADGYYLDMSSVSIPIFSYRTSTWDMATAQTNSITFNWAYQLTSSALFTLNYRLARIQDVNVQGKALFMNYAPETNTESFIPVPRFAETAINNNVAFVHFCSPLGFANTDWERSEADIAASIRYKLMAGGLYQSAAQLYKHDNNIIQDLYPVRPIELHLGYIIGDNKIITCVSGQFGFGSTSTLNIKIYDKNGFNLPDRTVTVNQSPQGTLADVQLGKGELAIISK